MSTLQQAITEVVSTCDAVTDVDRAFDASKPSINEPGIIVDVDVVGEYPYMTIDGRTHKYILQIMVVFTNRADEQAATQILRPISPRLNAKFRDTTPTHCDYWLIPPLESTDWGFFKRDNIEYPGFSKRLEIVGSFDA